MTQVINHGYGRSPRGALLASAAIVGLVWSASQSVRAAAADADYRLNTPESLRRALALAPGNPATHAVLAEFIEGTGGDPDPEFVAATRLNPTTPGWQLRLALRQEVEGRISESERTLMNALAIDRGFATRWALQNFYFRRGNQERFWFWTRQAFETSYGDRSPIFRLCQAMSDDPAKILTAMPPRRDLLSSYLKFLLASSSTADSASVAVALAAVSLETDAGLLLEYIDRAVATAPDAALSVWNQLCERRLLPFHAVRPGQGNAVTNGTFGIKLAQRGFDWGVTSGDGISIHQASQGNGIVIALSGRQIEDFVLLSQVIPLATHRNYRMNYEFQVTSGEPGTGMFLEVVSLSPDTAALAVSPELREQTTGVTHSSAQETSFNSDAYRAARIRLRYRRPSGRVRWEGTVVMNRIAVEPAP